jgi:microcystin-dependent protein
MALSWLTGNTPPVNNYVCRRLLIPNDLGIVTAVNGAILTLTEPESWEQVEGTLTPEESADLMATMFYEYVQGGCMIGLIAPYVTTLPPKNCLPCDGSTYLRVDYLNLYDLIDVAYIVDADSFNVPDLRDKFALAAGPTHAPNSTGGAADVSLAGAENGQHSHTTDVHSHTTTPHSHTEITAVPSISGIMPPPAVVPSAIPGVSVTGPATVLVAAASVVVNDSGSGDAHENMPPYTALNYCIVAR